MRWNEARYNLGISDSSGFVGRSLSAPKAFYANGTYTRSPLARYAKVTLTGARVVAVAAAGASNNAETFSGAGGGAGATIIVMGWPVCCQFLRDYCRQGGRAELAQ